MVFTASKHITAVNDELFLADLTAPPIEDFQLIANSITVKWRSVLEEIYGSSKVKSGNHKTFLHDEVYAMYVQFELTQTGTFTEWFHIPGRELGFAERSDTSYTTGGLKINGREPTVYEIQDTAFWAGVVNSDGTRSGDMGAWENYNETYPTGFPGLAGQKVRHHKFPSMSFMRDVVWAGNYGVSQLDRLGVDVVVSGIDPTKIKGYRIGYAKRTLADVSILGMGLTMFTGTPESPNDPSYFISPAGNWRLACQDAVNDDILVNKSYLRFNSFDIWQDRPSIIGCYLRNYIKLRANKLAVADAGYAGDSTYGTIAGGDAAFDLVSYASNFSKAGINNTVPSSVTTEEKVRNLTQQTYVPNNVKFSQDAITIDNRLAEETIHAKIGGPTLTLTTTAELKTVSNAYQASPGLFEETFLAALKTPKSDFFIGFDNQTIITNSQIVRGTPTGEFMDIGDSFIGLHSYTALAPYKGDLSVLTTDTHKSVVNFKMHVGAGRHNVNQRFLVQGDYSSYFFPDAGLFTKAINAANLYWFHSDSYLRTQPWNVFQYSKDFSTVNDLEVFGVFDRDSLDQAELNYRIHKSTRASRENSLEDGWKTFKALDYFDTVRDKGLITNLEAWGTDALIIHHARGLFRTRDKAVLKTDIINISLGSGDIFAVEPREINPTNEGTGGTQHKFSCRLTPYGYIFVDKKGYTVYQYDGNSLNDIGKGLSWFFADNLTTDIDNPFNNEGITVTYDSYYDRLLLSHKALNSFTLSFDFERKEWVFAHDFIPDYMFNTRSRFYSFKTIKLYEHNVGAMGNYYGTDYPFYVDFILNDQSKVQKVLSALYWLTKVKSGERAQDHRKTITSVTIWNDQVCTGVVNINTNETASLFVDANAKVVDENWAFNDLVDLVNDPTIPFVDDLLRDSRPLASNLRTPVWYDSEPLRGKFFIVRLEYSNIENKEVHLRELQGLLRASN